MSKFCPLPWMHLASHPAGYVTLCCEADHTGLKSASYDITDPTIFDGQPSFYNLKYHKLDRVLNSQSFNAVRKQMLNDQIPSPCQGCFDKEAKGLESKRLRETRNFPTFTEEKARSLTQQDGSIRPHLEFVELRMGNICNARCVTCNPLSSSQWRQDYLKLANKFEFMRDRYQMMDKDRFVTWPTGYTNANVFELDWPRTDGFWQDLLHNSGHLKVVYINGGEPTLINQHWDFLKQLADLKMAQNIELNYSINMTNLPEFASDLWRKFKKVRVACSIDDLELRNTYIRYPSDWDAVSKNFATLFNDKVVELSVCQTVSAMNYGMLDEFFSFMNESGVYVYYNFVNDPAYFSPKILPLELRTKLHERYKNTLPPYLYNQLHKMYGEEPQDTENAEVFKNVIAELDSIRGTSFANTFPEIARWLK